jgi:ParB-like chromosome segregation protein Spo0J
MSALDLEYLTIPIDLIDPHPDNPRMHPDEQLAGLEASFKELGQFRSFVVWKRPNGRYTQVTSHGITEAMKREGATVVRVEAFSEQTDPLKIKRVMLADNLHAQKSQDNEEILASLLTEQQNAGFDLASLGSDDETLRQMLAGLGDAYLGEDKPDVQFKEFDESIADDLNTEMCQQCGKLCLKGKGNA